MTIPEQNEVATGPDRQHRITLRPATSHDRGAIEHLAEIATRDLLWPFLTDEQRAETSTFTPLDPWLLEDGSYYVLEINGRMVAAGGWSQRTPMIHDPRAGPTAAANHSDGVARIRAMYTDPAHARRGLGRLILSVCEISARLAGVNRLELIATPVGALLYKACGYETADRVELNTPGGVVIPATHMHKIIGAGAGHLGDADQRHPAISR